MMQSNERILRPANDLSNRLSLPRKNQCLLLIAVAAAAAVSCSPATARASGISVDAGLTPAEDRWILRTQGMYMQRKSDPTAMDREMSKYGFKTVLAYGLKPDFTIIARQTAEYQKMNMGSSATRDTGLGDLLIMAKQKIYRHNTRNSTFGIASTLGLELPTGADAFSSDTWDVRPGLYASWRRGPWATDLSVAYKWNGFADKGKGGVNPGNELAVDWALAYQISIGDKADTTVAPVLELSYLDIQPDQLNGRDVTSTGEYVLYLSPGVKFTKSSFILEALLQIPVRQSQRGTQLERGSRLIVGTRWMF